MTENRKRDLAARARELNAFYEITPTLEVPEGAYTKR